MFWRSGKDEDGDMPSYDYQIERAIRAAVLFCGARYTYFLILSKGIAIDQ